MKRLKKLPEQTVYFDPAKLRLLREAAGMARVDVALELGLAPSGAGTIGLYECYDPKRRRIPKAQRLAELGELFGVPPESLCSTRDAWLRSKELLESEQMLRAEEAARARDLRLKRKRWAEWRRRTLRLLDANLPAPGTD